MKNCTYCGKEYPDDFQVCSIDGAPLRAAAEPMASTRVPPICGVSPAEEAFWNRMNFRTFAVVLVRLLAVWSLICAAIEATLLPRYVRPILMLSSAPRVSAWTELDLFWVILRLLIYVGAAVFLIQRSERVLSWIVKDLLPTETHEATVAEKE